MRPVVRRIYCKPSPPRWMTSPRLARWRKRTRIASVRAAAGTGVADAQEGVADFTALLRRPLRGRAVSQRHPQRGVAAARLPGAA